MAKAAKAAKAATAAKAKPESTAIAVVEDSKYLAINGKSTISEETLAANKETIEIGDLTKVKVPSGGDTTWLIKSPIGDDEATRTIEGVFAIYAFNGVLWPTEGDSPSGSLPVLISPDLKRGYRMGDDLGDLDLSELDKAAIPGEFDEQGRPVVDWEKLSYCQWGSSGRGNGKRAKERRIIGVLREGDKFPILINCPPTSLRNVTGFVKKLIMADVPHYQTVIRLSLSKTTSGGNDFSVVEVEGLGKISDEEAAFVRERFTKPTMKEFEKVSAYIETEE